MLTPMAMGEVVNQANDAELVSNMLAATQGNRSSLMNPMDPLGIIEGEQYVSPVCPCPDVNSQRKSSKCDDNSSHPLSNKTSPLHGSNVYNEMNNTFNQVLDEHPPLQPRKLFNAGESPQLMEGHMHMDEERVNPQATFVDMNSGESVNSYRIVNRYSFHEFLDGSPIHPQKFSENGPRRHAWSDGQQRYLQNEGYNSDSDILKNSTRSKKSSWEQPSSGSSEKGQEKGNHFIKSHRRVKSGDAAAGFYVNNTRYHPSHTSQYPRPPLVSHAHSQGNISVPHPEQRIPVLNHQPISVDTSVSSRDLVHQHLCHQSTAFVRLQAAIAEATKEAERLEREVSDKFVELNAGLNVKQNPTHKECELLEAEVNHLTTEIQAMYDECDRLGVFVPGDNPSPGERTSYHYPIPPRYSTPPVDAPPITVQPKPKNNKQTRNSGSNYENIKTFNKSKSSEQEVCNLINSSSPPPIPPRIPQKPTLSEHWECPKCTFNNLCVSDCEICLTPRPTTLR